MAARYVARKRQMRLPAVQGGPSWGAGDLGQLDLGGGLSASVASVGRRQYASAKDADEAFDALEQAL
ncbi:hypothetical protein ACF1BB_27365 [Streptomyces griseoluteus]|uniref:hypothetical protein n=1 Tax=Streptomyces griseoluteus TaxID=29306 RepID=UPI0036F5F21B